MKCITENQKDLFASCLVIITTFVLIFNYLAFIMQSYVMLVSVDIVYGLLVYGFALLLTRKYWSEEFYRLMSALGILGSIASVGLIWLVFTLPGL